MHRRTNKFQVPISSSTVATLPDRRLIQSMRRAMGGKSIAMKNRQNITNKYNNLKPSRGRAASCQQFTDAIIDVAGFKNQLCMSPSRSRTGK
jgi:hypothetical protein